MLIIGFERRERSIGNHCLVDRENRNLQELRCNVEFMDLGVKKQCKRVSGRRGVLSQLPQTARARSLPCVLKQLQMKLKIRHAKNRAKNFGRTKKPSATETRSSRPDGTEWAKDSI